MKYRRKKHGDVNSIVGLFDHVQSKNYENINLLTYVPDEPFYFGCEIKEGSDECHFHLDITSKILLQNARNACSFHNNWTSVIGIQAQRQSDRAFVE